MDGFGNKARVQKRIRRGEESGYWQAVVPYFEYVTESDGDAGPVVPKKRWKTISKLTSAVCYPGETGRNANRGRKDAERQAAEWLEALRNGEDERTEERHETVHERVLAAIEARQRKHGGGPLAPHTRDDYLRCLRYIDGGDFPGGHIDGIGDTRIEKLTKRRVRAWVEQMQGIYAPQTVKKSLVVLRDIGLAPAVEDGAIPSNPAAGISVPDPERREPNYLDNDGLSRLLDYLERDGRKRQDVAIKTALFTGMREQEVCGLRWSDIDLQSRIATVRRVVARSGNGFVVRDKPKTQTSRREVPITDSLADDLIRLKADMDTQLAKAIPNDVERRKTLQDLYCFGRIDGRYLNPRMLYKAFKKAVTDLELTGSEGVPVTFHDLRHSFSTIAINDGIDYKSVQSILGHSSAAVTLNLYTASEQETKRRAVERIEAGIRRRAGGAEVVQIAPTGTDGE